MNPMPPPGGDPPGQAPPTFLDKVLRSLSVITLLMTVPQAMSVWSGQDVGGVSLVSWATYLVSACVWFFYGLKKRDKTIYLACIGWVILDTAIVAGVVVNR